MVFQRSFVIATSGRGTQEITHEINKILQASTIDKGLCQVFCQHTSASLLLCENADPDVQRDLGVFMQQLVPDGDPRFIHTMEGKDDMPAHIRTVLSNPNLSVPISNGQLALGTWQGIFLWEHRLSGHTRNICVTLVS
ncbi:MAG: secondary thiamine-phosphate synthase enzyme YjbQ [Cycloclasticus sp.]|nr:secondary thiamine-phosphate synthase enzyme YjbQ [Cycloclasticus sp.]MBQ0790101.1 secondary thiamine-phosphate synthase enzyme YjbQ [Cycloclasticus sp.]